MKTVKPSKRHHYISQFYLAGFTSDSTKDGDIYCFDLETKLFRKTKTKEIAFENHFNDIDAKNVSADVLESKLSEFEDKVAPAFTKLRKTKNLPFGIELDKILNFMALVLVRNPSVRSAVDKSRTDAYFNYLERNLSSKKIWERFKERIESSGKTIFNGLPYKDAREKLLPRSVKLQGDPSSYHEVEFDTIDEILPLLALRSWELVFAPPNNSFITSDQPLSKIWTAPFQPPPNTHGLKSLHTVLLFPVSEDILLLGTFEDDIYKSNPALKNPPMVNNLILDQCNRFVYSSKSSFAILNEKQEVYISDKYFSLYTR